MSYCNGFYLRLLLPTRRSRVRTPLPAPKLMSDLLSHRLRHQDRQLSSLQVSKDGIAKVNGPQSRKMIN